MMRKQPFTEDQVKAIQGAIATAEMHTSGEIRIHVARRCKNDPFQEAVKVFDMLKMHQTEQRNGVLFFISLSNNSRSATFRSFCWTIKETTSANDPSK